MSVSSSHATAQGGNTRALGVLTSLFFMMGFITCLNDILIPHLKEIFDLSYTQAMLIQFCFFTAYALMSIPMSKLVEKIGYKGGVIGGFVLTAIGCVLFYPAASSMSYPVFLGALFILASGVVLLQTAGNPYVTILAKPGKESVTLTLVQAFNSLGTTIAPMLGSLLILADSSRLSKAEQITSVQMPYLGLAGILILLAAAVAMIKLPDARIIAQEKSEESTDGKTSVFQYKHLVLGALAIFCYVGAEVSIGSLLVSVMKTFNGLSEQVGGQYVAFYWGGAMVGRFLGAAMMNKIAPYKYLTFNAVVSIALIATAIGAGGGSITMWALIAIGFFNSIMFPTIFSLATNQLGKFTSAGAGVIGTAIVGGAIIPLIQGFMADTVGLLYSFVVSALCYAYIVYFAAKGHKLK